ncbi:MAG: hypothetical protein V1917_00450 [Candidatus Gottesmanbacteria bacterium]
MQKVRLILQKKPSLFLIGAALYIFVLYLIKWNIHPTWSAAWFILGSVIGTYFLEIAEDFFHLDPSPFRSVVFVGPFSIVSFFVVSSSGSFLAAGLVLSIFLTLVFWQLGEWMTVKHLNRWYNMVAEPVVPRVQLLIMMVTILFFFIETLLFLRGV